MWLNLVSRPHPQKLGQGPGHTYKIPHMCWVSDYVTVAYLLWSASYCLQYVDTWPLTWIPIRIKWLAGVNGHTIDQEIFTLKIIRVKIFCVDKFLRFVWSAKCFYSRVKFCLNREIILIAKFSRSTIYIHVYIEHINRSCQGATRGKFWETRAYQA